MTSPAAPIALIPADSVLAEIRALRAEIEARLAAPAAAESPEYLPFAKLAARFGFSTSTAHRYIASAITDHRLRTIRPRNAMGVQGDTLYHVADFTAYISR